MAAATAAVAFTPDGDLAIGSQFGPIRIVDPHTGAELRRLDSPQETSNLRIVFTQDGTEMVTIGSFGMMRFDVASGEPAVAGAATRAVLRHLGIRRAARRVVVRRRAVR